MTARLNHISPRTALLADLRTTLAANDGAQPRHIPALTAAQLRMLNYLPTHLSFKEIGEALFISRNTAKTHALAIYRKFGVSSRREAVEAARQYGILSD